MSRAALRGLLIFPVLGSAATGEGAPACSSRFVAPPAPLHASDHNGVALQDTCFDGPGPHHVFVIGDWGGVNVPNGEPAPADHRSPLFPAHQRPFVKGVDDRAQQRVAEQMQGRAQNFTAPDYILNVGDSFYWGGIRAKCGAPPFQHIGTGQWQPIFELMYKGHGIDSKQWLGVLGNHDYGGFSFTSAWDQIVGYTWGPPTSTGRWMMPAQYWKSKVRYPDFSVDYFFTDTNVFNAFQTDLDGHHNLCSRHNLSPPTCGSQGPTSLEDCPVWFNKLWKEQLKWLKHNLAYSTADWQVIVSHYPPEFGIKDWAHLAKKYGIDLYVAGHRHMQEVHSAEEPQNVLNGTAYVISGGGGGITSDAVPSEDGEDDQYGFMDLTLSRDLITIESISHGGQVRSTTLVTRRHPGGFSEAPPPTSTVTTSTIAPSTANIGEVASEGGLPAMVAAGALEEPLGQSDSCATYGCVDYKASNACQCNAHCKSHDSCCPDYDEHCSAEAAQTGANQSAIIVGPRRPAEAEPQEATGMAADANQQETADMAATADPYVFDQKPRRPNCALYGCGVHFVQELKCQCSPGCLVRGDCCADYRTTCSEQLTAKQLGQVAPSSEGSARSSTHSGHSCHAYGCVSFSKYNTCQCDGFCEDHGNCCPDYLSVCHYRRHTEWLTSNYA